MSVGNVFAHPALDAGARSAPPVPQDASAGMARYTDAEGHVWAYNPVSDEWQRTHIIRSGDTLWKLSGVYYGSSSLGGVREIFNVPQNKAIQGGSPDTGLIPDDIILIPSLPQPVAPPGTGGGSSIPIEEVPQTPSLPTAPPDATIPGASIPGTIPIDYQFPQEIPSVISAPGEVQIPSLPAPTPVSTAPTGPNGAAAPEKFWTTPKIVAAGAGVVVLGGGLVYLATRKRR